MRNEWDKINDIDHSFCIALYLKQNTGWIIITLSYSNFYETKTIGPNVTKPGNTMKNNMVIIICK